MASILYFGDQKLIGEIETKLDKSPGNFIRLKSLEELDSTAAASADLLLIGPDALNPVALVQKAFAADKQLAVIVLLGDNFVKVKQAIQLSPFIGKNVLCIQYNGNRDIRPVIEAAIQRTEQRRSFRRINLSADSTQGVKRTASEQIEYFGLFLEQAPVGALLIDENGQVLAMNTFAEDLLGMSFNGAGTKISQIFSKEEIAEIMPLLQHPEEKKTQVVRQRNRHIELSGSVVYNENRQKFILLLMNDITERIYEDEKIRSVLEGLPQMAWTADTEGKVSYFTKSWFDYTGQTREEAIGIGWTNTIFPSDLRQLLERWNSAVRSGLSYQHTARFRRIDGEYRWHLTKAVPIRNPGREIELWVGTCTDIHDQVLHSEELERKVKERTELLEQSNSELEQYAHVTSHDLQEPLRKVITFIDLLKENSLDKMEGEARYYLNKIETTAWRMTKSLKDLLNFTRLGRSEKFVPTDLNVIVRGVLDDFEVLIQETSAEIIIADLPVINAIPIQLQQLFHNLIGNALKFRKKDISPKINITARELPEEELSQFQKLNAAEKYYELKVQDNGIGFDSSQSEKIFAIFQRLHNRTEYSGTGIGLAICKKVVANHEGIIYARSEQEKGSSFFVILRAGLQ